MKDVILVVTNMISMCILTLGFFAVGIFTVGQFAVGHFSLGTVCLGTDCHGDTKCIQGLDIFLGLVDPS